MDVLLLYLILFVISIIQSIVGVGILVVGTPIMLLMNFNILEIMKILLPISIISSVQNLIIIKFFYSKKKIFFSKQLYNFFLFCLPTLIIGIYIIENFSNKINFNILVSFIILISIYLKFTNNNVLILEKKTKNFFLLSIGFVHGITNSGGTLLTLFLFNKKKDNLISRYETHFFYLLLASSQLLSINLIGNYNYNFDVSLIWITIIVLFGSFTGNYLDKKLKKFATILIYSLAFITSIMLIFKTYIII